MFCAGIDYMDLMSTMGNAIAPGSDSADGQRDDIAGKAKFISSMIALLQEPFNTMARCPKPIVAAVHSGVIGAGVDMISAVDIRYASSDAYFSIREVAIGMAADVGTLQRLPKIVGNDSLVRELAFTGTDMPASEAKEFGLISRVFETPEKTVEGALELARKIASRSPVAVQGTKISLNYSREHTIEDGLQFMQIWNMSMLQSEDLLTATTAVATKQESPEFADL
ncbi:PREDICTED: delta(3,5)-Delta(2,4)-dienoyl-CoA isomerase, mitochondrial-like [Rhagoletis zephyria]|uniref:delta(3,5)-Delta(2,4)-dienoyl-CoA isomerase, mitochondrial-like n=1 Tax=Rhagoletis zephyria TaxID=28612 RepID=UPI000811A966|nr:PREDICTED: delta(3,5)-Delta(2,4)-dienoyl-CoA isomerase, mitochondrial-like [Rhagoletis zephyria]